MAALSSVLLLVQARNALMQLREDADRDVKAAAQRAYSKVVQEEAEEGSREG